jgi:hypothetical protein
MTQVLCAKGLPHHLHLGDLVLEGAGTAPCRGHVHSLIFRPTLVAVDAFLAMAAPNPETGLLPFTAIRSRSSASAGALRGDQNNRSRFFTSFLDG